MISAGMLWNSVCLQSPADTEIVDVIAHYWVLVSSTLLKRLTSTVIC